MKKLSLSIILCHLLLLSTLSIAQQKPATPPKPKPSADAEKKEPEKKDEKGVEAELSPLQQRGLALARQAGDDAVSLDDKRSAARIQAAAADLFWPREQEYARKLFQRAYDAASAYYRESKDDNLDRVGSSSTNRQDVRLEVIRAASKRDPVFGRELTDKYIEEKQRELQERRNQSGAQSPADNRMFGNVDPAADDLLRTASSLLDVDLKAAVELGQRSLAAGVTQGTPGFLAQLAGRDRAAADRLYLFALDRLLANPGAMASQLLLLGAYPFGENQVLVSDGNNTNGLGFGAVRNFQIDPGLVGRFLATAMTMIARTAEMNQAQVPDAASRAGVMLFAARVFEPKVNQYKPELMDQWRLLEGQVAAVTDPQASNQINQVAQQAARNQPSNGQQVGPPLDASDRIKAMLDRAQQTSNFDQRDSLYYSAAALAQNSGDVARATEIIGRISNLDFRRQVRDWINFDAATAAVRDKRFDDAHRYALEVSATDQRAYLLFEIARAALDQKDRQRAIELLDEAAKKAADADNTRDKLRALLGIAHLYASFDPSRAFEVMTDAIHAANKVPSYGPDDARLIRSLETPGGGSSSMTVQNVEGFDLSRALQQLASADFDRTLALAQSLESKSLKLAAIVAVGASAFEKSK